MDDKDLPNLLAALSGVKAPARHGDHKPHIKTLRQAQPPLVPTVPLSTLMQPPTSVPGSVGPLVPNIAPSKIKRDVSIAACRGIVENTITIKPSVLDGRVIPDLDRLPIGRGRKLRASFLYNDLHGFTKLVATAGTLISFQLLHSFVDIMSRIAKHYDGEVVDCAGDRILAIFHRAPKNTTAEPIHDSLMAALWMQTVMDRVIASRFMSAGVQNVSSTIGLDYGEVVAGAIGIRDNKRLVFFGEAANRAAKLQDSGGPGQIVASPIIYANRPNFLGQPDWNWIQHSAASCGDCYSLSQRFADNVENPPKLN